MNFALHTYQATNRFPSAERFGLTAQLRRAVASIPSNIAEGNGRTHRKEYLYHLSVARGSLREVSTLWELAKRLDYCNQPEMTTADEFADHIGRMLTLLIRKLEKTPPR